MAHESLAQCDITHLAILWLKHAPLGIIKRHTWSPFRIQMTKQAKVFISSNTYLFYLECFTFKDSNLSVSIVHTCSPFEIQMKEVLSQG